MSLVISVHEGRATGGAIATLKGAETVPAVRARRPRCSWCPPDKGRRPADWEPRRGLCGWDGSLRTVLSYTLSCKHGFHSNAPHAPPPEATPGPPLTWAAGPRRPRPVGAGFTVCWACDWYRHGSERQGRESFPHLVQKEEPAALTMCT